jgi:hypothetical protein
MHSLPLLVLLAWVLLGAALFRFVPVRIALLLDFLAGWMILPGADYAFTRSGFPYWVLGIALPSSYWVTKGTMTGLAALAGVLLFHPGRLKGVRPRLIDLPICLWCLAPVGPALAHPAQWKLSGASVAYLTLSWGVPWAMGRIFFSDRQGAALLARGFIVAALAYLPFCLYESIAGPSLYELFYGYQPYRMIGAERYVGYRPVCWMEDGNQLGIWMAATAWLAISLASWKQLDRLRWLGPRLQAGLLTFTTVLWQSAGCIVLFVALLPGLVWRRNWLRIAVVSLVALLGLGLVAGRAAGGGRLDSIARSSRLIRQGAELLNEAGRHSLLWRMDRGREHLRIALAHPLVGSGEWDWWRTGPERPWSLWLLVLGQYGALGAAALGTALLLPIVRSTWLAPFAGDWTFVALSGAAWMLVGDSLLNGAFPLPYLLLFGVLAGGVSSQTTQTCANVQLSDSPVKSEKTPVGAG